MKRDGFRAGDVRSCHEHEKKRIILHSSRKKKSMDGVCTLDNEKMANHINVQVLLKSSLHISHHYNDMYRYQIANKQASWQVFTWDN
jgi:hypothetical protein